MQTMIGSRTYSVKEIAKATGVSVRTLHYYDEIDLLVPDRFANGYRRYGEAHMLRLQQILLNREMGMRLSDIKAKLDDPTFDYLDALRNQRQFLEQRAANDQKIIRSIDNAIANLCSNEENNMNIFDGFNPEDYEDEVKEKWGSSNKYDESQKRLKSYGTEQLNQLKEEEHALVKKLASCLQDKHNPDGKTAMDLAEEHRLYIKKWFYPCDVKSHQQLGTLYVEDERFARHYDKHADGLASFLKKAIDANALRK